MQALLFSLEPLLFPQSDAYADEGREDAGDGKGQKSVEEKDCH